MDAVIIYGLEVEGVTGVREENWASRHCEMGMTRLAGRDVEVPAGLVDVVVGRWIGYSTNIMYCRNSARMWIYRVIEKQKDEKHKKTRNGNMRQETGIGKVTLERGRVGMR